MNGGVEGIGAVAGAAAGVDEVVPAIVLFGDVVGSRRAPAVASAWLRRLCFELEELYGADRLAPFAFTQGDELQGLLLPSADPVRGVLYASLHEESRPMRWAVVHGRVIRGEGPATERGGDGFVRARQLIDLARRQRDGLLMVTGDPAVDELLADLAPVLAELLRDLSTRQRTVARLALLDGLRQSEVADRLDVSRATVSVTFGRAGVRSIERLAAAVRTVFRMGIRATGT
jgi:DNA-binding CsgD family transcriptional regulator